MKPNDISQARNPDLAGSLVAMRRAAAMARRTALQTHTEIVVVRDGKPVTITAVQLQAEALVAGDH